VSGVISLDLRDISKSFGPLDVFSGISISTQSGCVVVAGPNGSGKSTLLRIIAGLLAPTSGEVIIKRDGHRVGAGGQREVVGLVATENLRFFARVRGLRKTDAELREALARLGLAGREDDRLAAYSSGMRQRVKYAFALVHDPPVLLLDEPSANLDEAGVSVVESVINERRRGIVVLATNDPSELRYGDQVLRLGA
jgi:heme exporter protein A